MNVDALDFSVEDGVDVVEYFVGDASGDFFWTVDAACMTALRLRVLRSADIFGK